jgi:type IV secretory pathway TraG/TraD family ATPase VirD4
MEGHRTGGQGAPSGRQIAALGYQLRLGAPWFDLLGMPVYHPWRLFEWWYFFDAYAPDIFLRGGAIAACSGFAGAMAAIACRCGAHGSPSWSRPTARHAGHSPLKSAIPA